MASGDTKTNQYLDIAANGTRADLPGDTCCETRTQTLIRGVAERVMDVEDELERLENNPDVVDIVATYADLQAYDTSQLTDKDIIRVLQDETRDGNSTYYRWSTTTNTWTYIGESKQYTDFVGTNGTTAGKAGLVPAPATTDAGKYLKANGTWGSVQPGPTVVQVTGTSTANVMSQNATTSMIYVDPSTKKRIQIGNNTIAGDKANFNSVAIGDGAKAYTGNDVVIGNNAQTSKKGASTSGGGNVAIGRSAAVSKTNTLPEGGIAIGDTAVSDASFTTAIGAHTNAQGVGSIALGSYATTTTAQRGVMNIGTTVTSWGYSNSNYRLLTGLYDPQADHDAATKGYVDDNVGLVTLSYGNSTWNDFLTAYNAGKIVYCRASSSADPSSGSQTRMAFMAYINNPTAPTSVEFQYVRSVSPKTAAQQCDQVFVYKLTNANGGTWSVETRDMSSNIAAGTGLSSSYSNGTLTLNATGGGGGGLTTLYYDESDMKFYEDSQFTTVMTVADVVNAIYEGGVVVRFKENEGYSQTKMVCAVWGPTTVTAANYNDWKAATMGGYNYNPEPLFISTFEDNTFQFGT